MNFGDKMRRTLNEQQVQYSEEEIYQRLLKETFEKMLERIEAGVVSSGIREGTLYPNAITITPLEYNNMVGIESPYYFVTKFYLGFNSITKLDINIKKNLFGKEGTVYFTVKMTDAGKKVFKDFQTLFNNEGITIKPGFQVWDDDYDSTLDKDGLLDNSGRVEYSIKVEDCNHYRTNKRASWFIKYKL